jgi:hypothetical protein
MSNPSTVFINLAENGIVQRGNPDCDIIRDYHPEVLYKFAFVCAKMAIDASWILEGNKYPDIIVSRYRDHKLDVQVRHSPHNFAVALDVEVSPLNAKELQNREAILDKQIEWITNATVNTELFLRGGLYPQQNTIHLDICTPEWCEKYNGTKYWVKWYGNYTGFSVWGKAVEYARGLVYTEKNNAQLG